MFSPSLGRVARTTCALPSSCAISSRPATALASANQLLTRGTQQRRNSSTSCPPDNSKPSGASQTSASKESGKKAGTRSRSKKPAVPQVNVPHVPPTSYLEEKDVALSSFFSVHRPISVTTAIPTASSEASFNSLFESRSQNNRFKYGDVIYTIGNTVKNMEGRAQASEEADLRQEILQHQQQDGVHHLDGHPGRRPTLNEVLAQMRPFDVPPAPVPFTEQQAEPTEAQQEEKIQQKPTKRVWRTTLTVTESTDATGQKTLTTAASPVIQLPTRTDTIEDPAQEITIRQPFLERMAEREQQWRRSIQERSGNNGRTMHAISVKRQRKLKMKKHKYKKLMKRTRNLRRKLGQL